MIKEHVRRLFNNGILKAWLDGKTLQQLVNHQWTDLIYSTSTDDLSGLNLRIKPEPIKQTLEWFSFLDSKPEKLYTPIIFSKNNKHIIVQLMSDGRYAVMYDGYQYVPLNDDYWAYLESPEDVPF